MPAALRSRPSVARERVSASSASEEDSASEEVLREVARVRREVVSAAWAWEEDSRVGIGEEGGCGWGAWGGVGAWDGWRRLRSVDDGGGWRDDGGGFVGGSRSARRSSDEEEEASESFRESSSWSRSVRRFNSARWRSREVCAACLRDWTLMAEDSCSRRRSSVRAYSRFLGIDSKR